MIVMDAKLHNFFAFKNFHANFSYPKKIVDSNIEGEYLKEFPNFRYKKVNILMGSNATGKTTLGKAFIAIFNFIQRNNPTLLIEAANLKEGKAFTSIDFVANNKVFRIQIIVQLSKKNQEPEIVAAMHFVKIHKNDNYEKCAEQLSRKEYTYSRDVVSLFDAVPELGWYFSDVDSKYLDEENRQSDKVFIKVLNAVMFSFDTFIRDVRSIEDDQKSILIKFNTGDSVIYHNGEVVGTKNILSKGTESSIAIAEILTNVLLHKNGFYYCDEKFCFVQSDLEKTILSVLIELLGQDQQLFFTTHNTDILDLDLPKHSYSFFRKNTRFKDKPIDIVSASYYLKKQRDSLRNAVENDLFSSAPDDSKIFEILNLVTQED